MILWIAKYSLNTKLNEIHKLEMIFYSLKALIGSYICSDVPGEFMWKPGPLFQVESNEFFNINNCYLKKNYSKAVSGDCWLLLEDFDNSPVDSLSLLIDLLETKSIKTNSNTSIELKPNFRLFLTMRYNEDNFFKWILQTKKILFWQKWRQTVKYYAFHRIDQKVSQID